MITQNGHILNLEEEIQAYTLVQPWCNPGAHTRSSPNALTRLRSHAAEMHFMSAPPLS